MNKFMYSLKQALKQIGRNKGMTFTSVFAITAMLIILGLFFMVIVNINTAAETIKNDYNNIEVFFEDDVTDISYSNGGQIWLKTLSKGVYQVERPDINDAFMEKLAFQCSNVMGKTFNMAHPLLDAESAELRMNFVHDSIATNGIACLIRKTPAKIRLNKQKLLNENYVIENLHDFL